MDFYTLRDPRDAFLINSLSLARSLPRMAQGDFLVVRRRMRLFVFNDTVEGPRAPAVKSGRVAQI
jgi:hypothetical protein